jgi:hypothetical protein
MKQSIKDNAAQAVTVNATGFNVANNIFKKWGCTVPQILSILQMSKTTYHKAVKDPASVKLVNDQMTRISFILNIHAACGLLFDNPENRYGFMGFKNNNGFFAGRAPIDVITSGNILDLFETYKHIDGLRGGQW